MNELKQVRIGVVGVGRFGRLHALTLAGLSEAELVAIVDTDEEARQSIQKELPGIPVWEDLATALGESEAEAWVIATRPATHIPLSTQTLSAGCKVLIEKPLAQSYAEAEELLDFIDQGSEDVMLSHTLLFVAEIKQLLTEIRERGEVIYFHSFRHRPASLWHPERSTPLRELMVHDLYLAYVIVEGEEPIQFSARIHPRKGGGSDLALVDLAWENDLWGSFTASFITPPGMGHEGYDRIEVYGQGWAARLELVPQPLEIWTDRAEWPLGLDIYADPDSPSGWLAEELRHFCRVVRGEAQVPFGARYEDALRIMDWLERLEASTT
ncbi:MAG: Gfo/Idh/MocA family oxidoreductase [Anaerolineales bacterium]|nr:Gfo/Idh/MocA family oxidoreductase [Anaerolineales bacterium]